MRMGEGDGGRIGGGDELRIRGGEVKRKRRIKWGDGGTKGRERGRKEIVKVRKYIDWIKVEWMMNGRGVTDDTGTGQE